MLGQWGTRVANRNSARSPLLEQNKLDHDAACLIAERRAVNPPAIMKPADESFFHAATRVPCTSSPSASISSAWLE